MKTKLLLPLLAALAAGPASLHAQTTAFTYQGKLVDDCCPATGLYDLHFRVYDQPAGGAIVGGIQDLTAVPVTNGLFTVSLDFGGGVFTGPRRWLQILARTNNAALPFVSLAPRTELTPTPYALYAQNAGVANSVGSGSVSSPQLNTPAGAPTSGQILSFDGTKLLWTSLNSAGGVILPYSGTASSPGSLFTLNNSGTGPAATFLGKVGIGTTTPAYPLDVNGLIKADGFQGYSLTLTNLAGTCITAVSARDRFCSFCPYSYGTSIDAVNTYFNTEVKLAGASGDAILANGQVYITHSASDLILKLQDKRADDSSSFLSKQVFFDYYSEAAYVGLRHNGGLSPRVRALAFGLSDANSGPASEKMRIDVDGRVGIGTTTPGGKLHVYGNEAPGASIPANTTALASGDGFNNRFMSVHGNQAVYQAVEKGMF